MSNYLQNNILELSHEPWTHDQVELIKLVLDGRVTWYDIDFILYHSSPSYVHRYI